MVVHIMATDDQGPTFYTDCGIPIDRLKWVYRRQTTLAKLRTIAPKARWCQRCNRYGTEE